MQFSQGSNLPRIKHANQAAIHRILYHYGPITRAEIAERLELTVPTVTTNVNAMISDGIIREVGILDNDTPTPGRRVRLLDIVPESRLFIGVEMRGTLRSICIVDYRGKLLYSEIENEACYRYEDNIRKTADLIRRVLSRDDVTPEKICGIGICVPGVVDNQNGILKKHPGYNWTEKDVVGDIRKLTGYAGPISLENNACARAYSAQLFRRDLLNNAKSFAYMFISQGIACPMVYNFLQNYGSVVCIGEVGHMVMDPFGPQCVCGNKGCLEAYASDQTICKRCEETVRMGEAPILRGMCKDSTPLMDQVIRAQEAGEASVNSIVGTAIRTLGIALANVVNFARPDLILLEGKLFLLQENRKALLDIINQNLYVKTNLETDFVFMDPEDFSGARGGAAVAIRNDLG